jgi:EPS-associated MarR family transcriptional regulator
MKYLSANITICSTREHLRTMTDEITYKLFKALEEHPATNQRHLAANLEMSLGKLNYCLKALLEKGLVKAENFVESNNKRGYLYKLTPAGIIEKAAVTMRYLHHKELEYNALVKQLSELRAEAKNN